MVQSLPERALRARRRRGGRACRSVVLCAVYSPAVSEWGQRTFGDPCRVCGFDWSMPQDEAEEWLAGTAKRYALLLGEADGTQRHPELEWNVRGYVCHVADSLRVWAERLANAALGDPGPVADYNQDRLANARSYGDIGIRGALWSLGRAVGDWQAALALASEGNTVVLHDELGAMTVVDVVRVRAHDVTHHTHDIEQSLPH